MNVAKENLIEEVTRNCQEKEVKVSGDLVTFLLNLLSLSSEYRSPVDNAEEVEVDTAKIVEAVTEKLSNEQRPSLVALKIQLYFAKHYIDRDEIIKKYRLQLHRRTGPLVAEICETDRVTDDREIEKLYQKILVVVTLLSGLGNPTAPPVLREVSVALQSVFLPSELPHYVTLSKRDKEEQLMELMCIVMGIRIFNRDCQRGGEGIDDLPSVLQEAIDRMQKSMLNLLEQIMTKIYKFTAAVDNVLLKSRITEEEEDRPPRGVTCENAEWAIEMLTVTRQQEIYVRKLLCDVERCDTETKRLMERLQARLFKLHDTVRYRTAVPTALVYPQFVDLADVWMRMQDEVTILSHVNSFLCQLQGLTVKYADTYNDDALDDMIGDTDLPTDAERLERSMRNLITDCGECPVFYPSITKDFDKIPLELLGFCAWSFVAGKGALIPGNPNIGIAMWKGRYYAFSSVEAAFKFGEDPDRYVYEILDFVRNHPEYVHLFQLYDIIESMRNREESTKETPFAKSRQDREIQTELHAVPPYVDRNYTSNIWEHKRRALQLATLYNSVTRSTQTYKSHFRSSIYVQAAPPKDKEVQTRRDNYTNPKRLMTFIFGLRGRRDDVQHVVSFEGDEFEHL